MLHQSTIEKLLAMRLEPMVETWRSFEQDENAQQLSFEEKLSLMVDRLWTWRQNLALERRLRYAKLRGNACFEDIDYRASRGLNRNLMMRSLANDSSWVERHVFIIGHRSWDILLHLTKSLKLRMVARNGSESMFEGHRKNGSEFAYRSLTKIQKGNFIYPKLMAWEGALGVVPENCDGLYVSPEFPVFEVRQDRVLPEVLDTYFRTPSVWPRLAAISTGTNVRRRRLHPKAFLQYKFPLPSMKVQRQLRVVRLRIEQLKREQSESAAELDALMPSILSKAFRGEL